MNLPQKISLWLGVVAVAFLCIRPPWTSVVVRPAVNLRYEQTLGFFFIWHDFRGVTTSARPDFGRLILELFPVLAITITLILTLEGQFNWHFPHLRRHSPAKTSR